MFTDLMKSFFKKKKKKPLKPMPDKLFNDLMTFAKTKDRPFLNIHEDMFVSSGIAVYLYSIMNNIQYSTENNNNASRFIKTRDIDFTVPIRKNKEIEQVLKKFKNTLQKFCTHFGYDINDFDVDELVFRPPVTINKFRGVCNIEWVRITYKKDYECFDFMFSKRLDEMKPNKGGSMKTGFPLQSIEWYISDLMIMFIKESLEGVENFAFKARNPFTGKYKLKGTKDFHRLKLLCSLSKGNVWCELSKKLELNRTTNQSILLEMFAHLRHLYPRNMYCFKVLKEFNENNKKANVKN